MLIKARRFLPSITGGEVPPHLTEEELNRLTYKYQAWFDERPCPGRARHWAIFLLLRYSGCRVSEAIQVNDIRDLDFRRSEIILNTLKRKKRAKRTVPLPERTVAEFGRLLAQFPELRGNLFRVGRVQVFKTFKRRAIEAGIPEELAHPHVLRHTRAIELLRAGVPVTAVQQLLGHASIGTTAVYLRFSGVEIRQILRDRGLI